MTHFRQLLIVVLLSAPSLAFAEQSPTQVVNEFYRWVMHPTKKELAAPRFDQVRTIVGKKLLLALEAQRSYEQACARLVAADVKPYMIDQNIFFSGPDGAKALESSSQQISDNVARVSVNFTYEDSHWTDTVLLLREDGHWVVLDIKWQDGWSLTKRLADFASNRCAP